MLHVFVALFLLAGGCLLLDGLAEQSWYMGLSSLPLLGIGLYGANWAGWFSRSEDEDGGLGELLGDLFDGYDD